MVWFSVPAVHDHPGNCARGIGTVCTTLAHEHNVRQRWGCPEIRVVMYRNGTGEPPPPTNVAARRVLRRALSLLAIAAQLNLTRRRCSSDAALPSDSDHVPPSSSQISVTTIAASATSFRVPRRVDSPPTPRIAPQPPRPVGVQYECRFLGGRQYPPCAAAAAAADADAETAHLTRA